MRNCGRRPRQVAEQVAGNLTGCSLLSPNTVNGRKVVSREDFPTLSTACVWCFLNYGTRTHDHLVVSDHLRGHPHAQRLRDRALHARAGCTLRGK